MQFQGFCGVCSCLFQFVSAESSSVSLFSLSFDHSGFDFGCDHRLCFSFMELFARAEFFCTFSSVPQASDFFASAGQTSENAFAVLGLAYPVDVGISFYDGMAWVDHYDLEPFLSSVFANPIGV